MDPLTKVADRLIAGSKGLKDRKAVTLSLSRDNWDWLQRTIEKGQISATIDDLISALREVHAAKLEQSLHKIKQK